MYVSGVIMFGAVSGVILRCDQVACLGSDLVLCGLLQVECSVLVGACSVVGSSLSGVTSVVC